MRSIKTINNHIKAVTIYGLVLGGLWKVTFLMLAFAIASGATADPEGAYWLLMIITGLVGAALWVVCSVIKQLRQEKREAVTFWLHYNKGDKVN